MKSVVSAGKARRKKDRGSEAQNRFAEELSGWLVRATQRGVKFIRWLRAQLRISRSWRESCEALTQIYARS